MPDPFRLPCVPFVRPGNVRFDNLPTRALILTPQYSKTLSYERKRADNRVRPVSAFYARSIQYRWVLSYRISILSNHFNKVFGLNRHKSGLAYSEYTEQMAYAQIHTWVFLRLLEQLDYLTPPPVPDRVFHIPVIPLRGKATCHRTVENRSRRTGEPRSAGRHTPWCGGIVLAAHRA